MSRPLLSHPFFHLNRRSLSRGNLLVLGSFALSVKLSDFPQRHATAFLAIPAILSFYGLYETIRCMGHNRWNLYRGGVLLCIYMDLMAISLILFIWLTPYVL